MKKTFLIAIIISMFVLRGLAAADLLSVGDYKMYLNPAASGGDILKSDSNFRLYDAKGETLGGTLPSTPAGTTLIFGTFGLTTRMPDPVIPAGTVKLYISRGSGGNSGNIIVTWEADVYPNTKIYVRTGDGSGSYQNSYVLMGDWAKVNNSDVIGQTTVNLVDGSLTHIGQVGAGTSEVYYKALDPIGQADLTRYIPNAWAVGKINVELAGNGGIKLIGLPLYSGKASEAFAGQLSSGQEIVLMPQAQVGGEGLDYLSVNSDGVVGPDVEIRPMTGFWIRNPKADPKTLTFTGALIKENTDQALPAIGLTGNPVALPQSSAALGANGDVVMPQALVGGEGLDYFTKTDGSWGANFPRLKFNAGLWYKYPTGGSRAWKVDAAAPSAVIE